MRISLESFRADHLLVNHQQSLLVLINSPKKSYMLTIVSEVSECLAKIFRDHNVAAYHKQHSYTVAYGQN